MIFSQVVPALFLNVSFEIALISCAAILRTFFSNPVNFLLTHNPSLYLFHCFIGDSVVKD